ncbi:DEKNAAC101446 [Brettanomyces naardenensis]|uniref:ATP-dependent RNA helicase DRS1 n=1 Tax=Brettanomyces naardenensis TaxID=13370 RepID=A0A448YI46_BRENA|nr:DEKNAAC101446 [Brettanomyces naardenensis]
MVSKIKKGKFIQSLDFIPTISDSETEEVPDLDDDKDEEAGIEEEERSEKVNKKKKGKKSRKKEDEEDEDQKGDINPEFIFDMGDDLSNGFEGWDFDPEENDEVEKKDVDLDSIIKRRGGLTGKFALERESESNEIEEGKEEAEADDGASVNSESDDELAMDGFGMGAKEEVKEEEVKETKEEEEETDVLLENLHNNPIASDSESETESEPEPEDSAEAIQKFYDAEEGEDAKKVLYKDFQSMDLSRPVLKGLSTLGYTKPTPVQSAAIPIALMGKDVVAGAQTGSGKTAAYMIPIIERLLYKPSKVASTRVVIMAPTRELAIQVADVAKRIAQFVSGITIGMAIGGLNLRQQEQELKKRPDIVIATPGRFIDHVRNSPSFSVDSVEILVLDEADRMLEEGFHTEITEILQLVPEKRQTLLFSATMNSTISDLIQLSLRKPVRIMIDPPKAAASGLLQEFVRIRKRESLKPALLYEILSKLDSGEQSRIIVFVATKSMAHRLRIILGMLGLKVSELHGALTQDQRLQSITAFKKLTVPTLICTDLAARGLDIPKIEVVINFDMPKSHEIYLHRVGRTARAGRGGVSISFVGEAGKERRIVREAIKQVEATHSGKVVGRTVDWNEVEKIHDVIESKDEVIKEIMEEEKSEKEMLRAEMEVKKGENMLKYKEDIESRPRRTWFQTEKEKKNEKVISAMGRMKKTTNSRKRKAEEAKEEGGGRSYKKTQKDRMDDQSGNRRRREIARKKEKKQKKRRSRA